MARYQIRKMITTQYILQEYRGNGYWGQLMTSNTEKECKDVLSGILNDTFEIGSLKNSIVIFEIDTGSTNITDCAIKIEDVNNGK